MTKSIDPEKTKLGMSIAKWITSTFVIVAMTWTLATWQHTLQTRIEQLYTQNAAQHEQIILRLDQMQIQLNNYALKRAVTDAFLWVNRQRDAQLAKNVGLTNTTIVTDEFEFRQKISELLR